MATRRPGLVTAIWSSHLVLGFALALPMYRWLYSATAYRPEADVLAGRFSAGGLVDLLQFDSAPVLQILQAAVAGGLLVAVLASPLLIAATLASVRDTSRDSRAIGGVVASLYWRFLLVIIIGRGAAAASAGLAATVAGMALAPLSESAWEPGFLWAGAVQAGTAVLVAVYLLAAVDYALVGLEAGRSSGPLGAWWAGVRQVVTRPGLTLGLWVAAGAMLALAVGVYIAVRELTGRTVPSPLGLSGAIVLQQGFMFTRTWLRVGLLAAEQNAFDRAHEDSRLSDWDPGSGPAEDTSVGIPRSEAAASALDGEAP